MNLNTNTRKTKKGNFKSSETCDSPNSEIKAESLWSFYSR